MYQGFTAIFGFLICISAIIILPLAWALHYYDLAKKKLQNPQDGQSKSEQNKSRSNRR